MATTLQPVLHVTANDTGTSTVFNTGTGPNGTFLVGGVPTTVVATSGMIFGGLEFNNTGAIQRVDFPLTGTTLDITGPITIAGWFKVGATNNTMLGSSPTNFDSGYWVGMTDTRIFSYLDGVANTYVDVSSHANTWTHLAVTYDGANVLIYKNGSLSKIVLATGTITNNAATLSLGYAGANYKLTGALDDIRIYDEALDYYEINSIYL